MYDLPILLAILSCSGDIDGLPEDAAFLGELSLTGALRRVNGILPMALAAVRCGIRKLYVPEENAAEATLADGIEVYPVRDVDSLIAHLQGYREIAPAPRWIQKETAVHMPDFADVMGQENVKRAMEIAAAGGHNILLIGAPGTGKSMLARRFPSILPDMTRQESLEATEIWSVAGLTDPSAPLLTQRPFRSPHHTLSSAAMCGGGSVPRPGEISLSHHGVLFLDELPEFSRDTLEALRQPLEDGNVTITRAAGSLNLPSRFMLVGAMNPCRCGWYGHPTKPCRCTEQQVSKYIDKISGPLLDRMDIHMHVPTVEYEAMRRRETPETSEMVRARVNAARQIQLRRFADQGVECNAQMTPPMVGQYCTLDEAGEKLLRSAFERLGMTARSHDRLLRVARTIADLDGAEGITPTHLAEAISYRDAAILRR